MGSLNWMIWRPVVAGYGSLVEVQEKWSLDDLSDALEALEVIAECERVSAKQQRAE